MLVLLQLPSGTAGHECEHAAAVLQLLGAAVIIKRMYMMIRLLHRAVPETVQLMSAGDVGMLLLVEVFGYSQAQG